MYTYALSKCQIKKSILEFFSWTLGDQNHWKFLVHNIRVEDICNLRLTNKRCHEEIDSQECIRLLYIRYRLKIPPPIHLTKRNSSNIDFTSFHQTYQNQIGMKYNHNRIPVNYIYHEFINLLIEKHTDYTATSSASNKIIALVESFVDTLVKEIKHQIDICLVETPPTIYFFTIDELKRCVRSVGFIWSQPCEENFNPEYYTNFVFAYNEISRATKLYLNHSCKYVLAEVITAFCISLCTQALHISCTKRSNQNRVEYWDEIPDLVHWNIFLDDIDVIEAIHYVYEPYVL